jgi:hypothetical protein
MGELSHGAGRRGNVDALNMGDVTERAFPACIAIVSAY